MDSLNFGHPLGRSDMKKLMAGSAEGSAGVKCEPGDSITCIDDCQRSTVEAECDSAASATCFPDAANC